MSAGSIDTEYPAPAKKSNVDFPYFTDIFTLCASTGARYFVDIQPDLVSIHIGINDTWHRAENRCWLGNDVFEAQYREVLTAIKEKTNAKILIIEQFLLPVEDKAFFRTDLNGKIDITRKLAREFADYYIPLDGLMAQACVG